MRAGNLYKPKVICVGQRLKTVIDPDDFLIKFNSLGMYCTKLHIENSELAIHKHEVS